MIFILAVAWADARGGFDLGPHRDACRQWSTGVRCQAGPYEVNGRQTSLKPQTTQRSAEIGRFLQLMDWPQCRFETAWMDGVAGWQARCDDGGRAWIGRWWVIEGQLLSQAISGPKQGIEQAANTWFSRIRFRNRAINAPHL